MTAPAPGEFPDNAEEALDIYEANDFDVAELRGVGTASGSSTAHLACPNL